MIFTRAEASGNRVKEVLDTENSILEAEISTTPDFSSESILAFDHVDFRYTPDSGLSLQGITFQLKRNTVLGIIGPTGSGKTTLTQLIPRFYDVSSGTVIMDGMDVRSWQLDHLRQQIALVPQTSVLFTGTIRENLQWGKQDATEDECWGSPENRSGRRICTSASKWFRYKSHGKRKKFLRRSKTATNDCKSFDCQARITDFR